MEIARFRRICRVIFFLGAMIALFGIGAYSLGQQTLGIILLIAGVVILMLCFSVTRAFAMYDFQHMTRSNRPPRSQEEKKE